MKLPQDSSLSLDLLKGALIYGREKDGTEKSFCILDFSISIKPCWDFLVLHEVMVSLIPIVDGKLIHSEVEERLIDSLKDYTIKLSKASSLVEYEKQRL